MAGRPENEAGGILLAFLHMSACTGSLHLHFLIVHVLVSLPSFGPDKTQKQIKRSDE